MSLVNDLLWPWASWTIRSLYKSSTVLSYMLTKNKGGQGDLQVSLQASTRLRLVSPQHFDHCDHVYSSKRVQTKINHIRFIKQTSLSLRWLELSDQTVRNVRRFACKFDFEPSESKSSQVHATPDQGVSSRPKFLTCVNLLVPLVRALSNQDGDTRDDAW